jgi:hypothetical protein
VALPNVNITVRAITARSAKSTWAILAIARRINALVATVLKENKTS